MAMCTGTVRCHAASLCERTLRDHVPCPITPPKLAALQWKLVDLYLPCSCVVLLGYVRRLTVFVLFFVQEPFSRSILVSENEGQHQSYQQLCSAGSSIDSFAQTLHAQPASLSEDTACVSTRGGWTAGSCPAHAGANLLDLVAAAVRAGAGVLDTAGG